MAEECERDISDDTLASEIRQIGNGARQATEVQRSAGLSVDFFTQPEGDAELHGLVHRAARGDRHAAYRIADAYKTGQMGVHANARRMEQWLRFSAELGDGRASWELAEHYNYGGLVADAAKYEKKAEELGYRPGVRLPSRGY
jgi:TPR repeat protein